MNSTCLSLISFIWVARAPNSMLTNAIFPLFIVCINIQFLKEKKFEAWGKNWMNTDKFLSCAENLIPEKLPSFSGETLLTFNI